jgi:hypothetical protein
MVIISSAGFAACAVTFDIGMASLIDETWVHSAGGQQVHVAR